MKTHKKIYYAGGMISLIFVPIIFWMYAKPAYDNLNLRVLDLGLPAKAKKGQKPPEYAVIPIDGYKYDVVNVPTNFNEEIEKKYFTMIENIENKNIDRTGIKFQFSDENSYGDVVKLVNLMQKANQDRFGLDTGKTNAFYLVHRKTENNAENKISVCGGVIGREYLDKNDFDYQHSNFFEKILKYSPTETYYLISGYLILAYFSLRKLLIFNKKTLQVR